MKCEDAVLKDTLVVLQCCKSKEDVELYPNENYNLAETIPRTYRILDEAITRFTREGIIGISSNRVTALSLYQGHFYRVPGLKSKIVQEIRCGPYQFLIMSAGYGIVHPFQRINNYESRMTGRITRYWLESGLPLVIEEFVKNGGYTQVFGFFSKSSDYLKIFEDVDWRNLDNVDVGGFFYLDGIRGASKVLKYQAGLLMNLLNNRFQVKPNEYSGADVVFVKTK